MVVPSFGFDNKVVLITGSSRGLGKAMALGFAEAGADVVVTSRDAAACEPVAEEIRALGCRSLAVGCHVGRWDECAALVDATVEEFGRVDVLVNNAGIAPVPPSLGELTEDLFDKTFAVNLKGPMRLTGLVAPHMAPGSSVINISSTASLHNTAFTTVYGAAKAGLNAFTHAAARELGPRGIRVNCIVCGTFWTDSLSKALPTEPAKQYMASQTSLGRIAEPDEIVGTALWMAGSAASYLNGECVTVDGGTV